MSGLAQEQSDLPGALEGEVWAIYRKIRSDDMAPFGR
jgi:hypothetical protein